MTEQPPVVDAPEDPDDDGPEEVTDEPEPAQAGGETDPASETAAGTGSPTPTPPDPSLVITGADLSSTAPAEWTDG